MSELPDNPNADSNIDLDSALDCALARSLPAPDLPAGFHARLHMALVSEATVDLARLRRRLEEEQREHARHIAALQSGYVRMKRDTLATVLAVAFSAGAVAHWAVPWLRETAGVDLSELVPLLAVAVGMAAGASVWIDRFGLPRALQRRR